jgi:Protein of unknown function (DUF1064)
MNRPLSAKPGLRMPRKGPAPANRVDLAQLGPGARRQVQLALFAEAERQKLKAEEVKPSKYGNKVVFVDGIRFASKLEARRYRTLQRLQAAGMISGLECQPVFPLVINGVTVARYIADFRYIRDGQMITEDCKSPATITPVYKLKKRLVEVLHGVQIVEVMGRKV